MLSKAFPVFYCYSAVIVLQPLLSPPTVQILSQQISHAELTVAHIPELHHHRMCAFGNNQQHVSRHINMSRPPYVVCIKKKKRPCSIHRRMILRFVLTLLSLHLMYFVSVMPTVAVVCV